MNTETPPTPPPPFEPPKPLPATVYPSPWKAAGIGVLVFIGSGLLCFVSPIFFLFGFVGAVTSLFIKGYRCIFLGYALGLGLALLILTIACAINPPDFR